MGTDPMEGICDDQCINEQQRNPLKKAGDTSETGSAGVPEVTLSEAEMGSLVAKHALLNEHLMLKNEDGVSPQIDCSVFFLF